MRRIIFPPLDTANEDGLLALGGDLHEDTLLTAYKHGIFPWPISHEYPLAWFSPNPRGVLFLEKMHIPK
jgi:leucyl/phenylalanyl-tRNA--protein transferase